MEVPLICIAPLEDLWICKQHWSYDLSAMHINGIKTKSAKHSNLPSSNSSNLIFPISTTDAQQIVGTEYPSKK